MAKILRTLGLSLALLGIFASTAWAKGDRTPPQITAHSQLSFGVRKGDMVTVEVQTNGENVVYKWVKSGTTICRAAICEFDTGDWGLGTHRITVVVFNELGSLSLKYQVRVLTVPPGYVPNRVRAPLVESPAEVETVYAGDHVVRSLVGRGFSYHRRKVQVVGPTPRALDWEERIRSQDASTLRFGREKYEEHLLAPRTLVYLARGDSGRRAIVLRRGVLRSRQLPEGKAPRWSIVVDPWLQIDTDAKGDVMVAREGDERDTVIINVLRGVARIYRMTDASGRSGHAITIGQGLEVRLTRDGVEEAPKLAQPDTKRLQTLFKATTPHYMPGQDPSSWGSKWTLRQQERAPKAAAALKAARQALAARDYMTALEALAPHAERARTSYAANLALGEACAGLGLEECSAKALTAAIKLKPDAARPLFLLAVMALGRRDWEAAISHFEAAQEGDYPDEQLLQYYLGVARYNSGRRIAAHQALSYSLWESGEPAITESADRLRRRLKHEGWFDLRLAAGAFYDSNVLRSDSLDPSTLGTGEIKTGKSAGYLGGGGFSLWPYNSETVALELAFDIEKRAYAESTLKVLEPLMQRLALAMSFNTGVDEQRQPPAFAAKFATYAGMHFVGEERATDQVGAALSLESPRLWGLHLTAASTLNLDPLPARDDLYDPIVGEIVAASERSSRELVYGLGTTPVNGSRFRLDADLKMTTLVYRNEAQRVEDYESMGGALALRYAPSLRQTLGFGVDHQARDFKASEDKRLDSRTAVGLDWRFYLTPAFYQDLQAIHETQTSNREVHRYKRYLLQLNLGLGI